MWLKLILKKPQEKGVQEDMVQKAIIQERITSILWKGNLNTGSPTRNKKSLKTDK